MATRSPATATADRDVSAEGVVLLTPAQAGKLIGTSRDHVYRLIADGVLRAVDVARPTAKNSKTRIKRDDLDEYIERMTRGSPPRQRDGSGPKPPSKRRPRRTRQTPASIREPGSQHAHLDTSS